MNGDHVTIPRAPLTSAVLGALLVTTGLLTGCTDGAQEARTLGASDAAGTVPPSASSDAAGASPSPSTETLEDTMRDRSSEVLAQPPRLTTIVTSEARTTSSFRGSTFTIHSLTSTGSTTDLTYSVTREPEHSSATDSLPRAWEKAPVLVTDTQAYHVVTFQEESGDWAAMANPAYSLDPEVATGPLTILYPPLPEETRKVILRGLWFEDVEVPVTHLGTG